MDIAREAADIILLEKSLMVLEEGVIEGRRTFANMLKYIKMTASSNFGNVFSVLVASAFLPFLPMLMRRPSLWRLQWLCLRLSLEESVRYRSELRIISGGNVRAGTSRVIQSHMFPCLRGCIYMTVDCMTTSA